MGRAVTLGRPRIFSTDFLLGLRTSQGQALALDTGHLYRSEQLLERPRTLALVLAKDMIMGTTTTLNAIGILLQIYVVQYLKYVCVFQDSDKCNGVHAF